MQPASAGAPGARVIGVLVGATASSTDAVNRLKQVVGPTVWSGTSTGNPTNAWRRPTSSSPRTAVSPSSATCCERSRRPSAVARHGAEADLRFVRHPVAQHAAVELRPTPACRISIRAASSITFDYQFAAGVTERLVEIVEQPTVSSSTASTAAPSVSPSARPGRRRLRAALPGSPCGCARMRPCRARSSRERVMRALVERARRVTRARRGRNRIGRRCSARARARARARRRCHRRCTVELRHRRAQGALPVTESRTARVER